MIPVAVRGHEVVDAHDLTRPEIGSEHTLADVEAAAGEAASVDHGHGAAGQIHDRGVSLAHVDEADMDVTRAPALDRLVQAAAKALATSGASPSRT